MSSSHQVLEETGYDVSPLLVEEDFIEVHLKEQRNKLYIIQGVSALQQLAICCLPGLEHLHQPAPAGVAWRCCHGLACVTLLCCLQRRCHVSCVQGSIFVCRWTWQHHLRPLQGMRLAVWPGTMSQTCPALRNQPIRLACMQGPDLPPPRAVLPACAAPLHVSVAALRPIKPLSAISSKTGTCLAPPPTW